MRDRRNLYKNLIKNLKGRNLLGELGVDGKMTN
jgi:hypothetical protein